jgi:hypothetical protein
VDHCIHPAQTVHVARDAARLCEVGEVADDDRGSAVDEVADGLESIAAAGVDDDIVSVVEQGLRCCTAKAVGGASDEDTCHSRDAYDSPCASEVEMSR